MLGVKSDVSIGLALKWYAHLILHKSTAVRYGATKSAVRRLVIGTHLLATEKQNSEHVILKCLG